MLAAAAAQVAPALAVPFNALNEPLLGFVEWVAATMAAAPLAVVSVDVGSPLALVAAYAALAAAALALRAAWRRSSAGEHARWSPRGADARAGDGSGWPGVLPASRGLGWSGGAPAGSGVGWPRGAPDSGRRAVAIGAAALVAVAVLIAAASTGEAPRPIRGELVVSFLDVGQGDATLLQTDRVAVLVDTGPPDGPIVQRLAEAGVERLDALVLTHAQTDHEGAALEVLREFPTRLVVNGGAGWPSQVQRGLDQAIRAARARRLDAHAGQVLTLAGLRLRILWPPPPPPGFEPTGDANNRAIVAHASVRDFDLLLPADAESNVTAALPLPEVEALKVAHHGSADDGLPALLERTKPAFAAIEVGRGNSYGHPAPSTLAALRVVGNVVRTDRDGTVRLRVRGGEMKVERTGRWRP
jgi:competence protein ComEC